MYNKLRISRTLSIIAIICGIWIVQTASVFVSLSGMWKIALGLIAFILFYITLNWGVAFLKKGIDNFNQFLDNISIEILLGGIAGLIIGILVGALSSLPISLISPIGDYLTIGVFLLSGYIGLTIGTRRALDVFKMLPNNQKGPGKSVNSSINYKVIDTSAIIDGRIYDVCLSHFLEGPLIVPTFVIEELQHIADSSDSIRRTKGRRGLELLSKMQKHAKINIDIIEANIYEEKEVDAKLIRLCKELNASIVTNDYNLNKVAELQGITVLNFNELANAIKVIVFPGETMQISIIKEGKESGQGVGYLDDGTMVVVEDANGDIGKDIEVMVTSVFQTAAGRMIFTRKQIDENQKDTKNPFAEIPEVNIYG